MQIQVQVSVAKETYELGVGVADLVKSIKLALADGWQVGTDLPAIIMSAVSNLAAIEGVEKLGDEAKEDPASFAKAIALGLADIYGSVKGPDEEPPVPA